MTKHHGPREFGPPVQPSCRVAEMAKRFAAAEKDWRTLDERGGDTKDADTLNEMMMRSLTDGAALDQPMSALGALFQVLVISQEAKALYDWHRDDHVAIARERMARLEGALWGVRRFLENQFGISAIDIGGDYMMSESTSFAGKLAKAVAAAPVEQADVVDNDTKNRRALADTTKQTVEAFRDAA